MSASVVLVNPSRVANLSALREAIKETVAEDRWPEPIWIETTPGDLGEGRTREQVEAGARVVFVCGGDGTVSAAAAAAAGTEASLAVLASGTGNVLARNLGLPTNQRLAARLATRGGRRRIDLGLVNGQLFAVAAGIGLDAQMLADARHRTKHQIGWLAYVAAVVRRLGDPRFAARISLDGGEPISREVRSVLVANVGRLPGGLTLIPGAVPDDGLLDVAVIGPRRLVDWASLLASLIGRHPKGGRLETFQVRRVEVSTDHPQPREADGEPLSPANRLSVEICAGRLSVCVPRLDGRSRPRG